MLPFDPAQQIKTCYQTLGQKNSNVVFELLKEHPTIYQWDHYPTGDVIDKTHHSQYYYHSHPSHDPDRFPEHGHFHIFLRKKAFPKNTTILARSKKHEETDGQKDNLSHAFAIAMNDKGLPTALFTVNHWVTNGLWYSAQDITEALHHYYIDPVIKPEYTLTHQWITAMVHLFLPHLPALLETRDQVIEDWQTQNPDQEVLQDRRLEVTSFLSLNI